jgi:iron complex outermembrane receptor protein
MSAALGGTAFAQAADDPGTQGGQDIVVTGSRGQARTVATSPTPIDVISGEQIAQLGGSMQLRDVLSQLVPSFQSQQVGSSSWNSVTRPAGLRGLSGVHVLVLVNGKRRHNSALIDLNSGSTSMGGNPVDLDQIPASAIARIEVLRDGAAAQYGTDAIAGVINVILKDNPNAGSGAIEAGQRYSDSVNGSDGETVSAQLSKGFHLGGNGSIVISAEGKLQKPTVRNSDYTGRIYPRINGADDPREATGDRRRYQGGLPDLKSVQPRSEQPCRCGFPDDLHQRHLRLSRSARGAGGPLSQHDQRHRPDLSGRLHAVLHDEGNRLAGDRRDEAEGRRLEPRFQHHLRSRLRAFGGEQHAQRLARPVKPHQI